MRSVSSLASRMSDTDADITNTEQLVFQYFSKATRAVECKCLSIAIANEQKKSQESIEKARIP